MNRTYSLGLTIIMLSIPLALAGDWVRPMSENGFSGYWQLDEDDAINSTGHLVHATDGLNVNDNAVFFDNTLISLFVNVVGGTPNVGIGTASPTSNLDIQDDDDLTQVHIDNTATSGDSSLVWELSGSPKLNICIDDSQSDEADFILGSSSCSTTDVMSLTGDGLEMGNGRIYLDRSTTWSGATISSRYNNQFTLRNTVPTTYTEIDHSIAGQPIWIVCNEAMTTLEDQGVGGNLQLAGDFTCGVGDTIHLIYNDAIRDWVEISRSNN